MKLVTSFSLSRIDTAGLSFLVCQLSSVQLEFSSEKTNMILFNNGSGPKELPQFKLNDQDLL